MGLVHPQATPRALDGSPSCKFADGAGGVPVRSHSLFCWKSFSFTCLNLITSCCCSILAVYRSCSCLCSFPENNASIPYSNSLMLCSLPALPTALLPSSSVPCSEYTSHRRGSRLYLQHEIQAVAKFFPVRAISISQHLDLCSCGVLKPPLHCLHVVLHNLGQQWQAPGCLSSLTAVTVVCLSTIPQLQCFYGSRQQPAH